jgi:hypothetical protein
MMAENAPMEEMIENFSEFIDEEITKNAGAASDAILNGTDIVYHYTDVNGALGILKSDHLWLTEIAHLNDPSEIKHGIEVACEILRDEAPIDSERVKLFASTFKEASNQTINVLNAHIASFSYESDDLCQWRAYADEGRGVALGFSINALSNIPYPMAKTYKCCVPMHYKDSVLIDSLQGPIREVVGLFDSILKNGLSDDEERKMAVAGLQKHLAILVLFNSLRSKHPAYAHEKEIRIIRLGGREDVIADDTYRIRERNGEIVEYLELPFEPSIRQKGTLKCIRIGPAAPAELVEQMQSAIRSFKIPEIPIDKSTIPFRSLRF